MSSVRHFSVLALVLSLVLSALPALAKKSENPLTNHFYTLAEEREEFKRWRFKIEDDLENNLSNPRVYVLHDISHTCLMAQLELHNIEELYALTTAKGVRESFLRVKLSELLLKTEYAAQDLEKRAVCVKAKLPLANSDKMRKDMRAVHDLILKSADDLRALHQALKIHGLAKPGSKPIK